MKRINIERLVGILLMVAVLTVFAQVARHDFINFDDGVYITRNSNVQSGLTVKGALWAFTSMEATNWHPLTWFSHMLDCNLYGLNPAGHHLTSLFFHVASTLLLCLVLQKATGRLWESAVVAALFGLHPVHVESVAWVSERKDVLSAFFWMLTMLAYIDYTRRPGRGRYALIVASFAFGLMAKPMLVTLPFVLLLLDFWPLGRLKLPALQGVYDSRDPSLPAQSIAKPLKRLVWEKVPLFVLSAALSVVAYIAQSKGGSVWPFESITLKVRVLNSFVSYVRYLQKMFWPHDLAIFYPHPFNSLDVWYGVAAGLFLFAVSVLMVRLFVRSPFLVVGWFWFLGTLVPVIGIVQVGGQAMADRYTYLPSIGIFIMSVWAISRLMARVPYRRVLLAFAASTILLSLSAVTWLQLPHWQNSETLFRHAVSVTKRNYVAHSNLGTALMTEDRIDEAVSEFKKALDIWPSYPDAHNNLGVALLRQGRTEEALTHHKEALRVNPKHVLARPNVANALVELGGKLVELGRLDEAVSRYTEALSTDPDFGAAHNAMGVVMARLNKMDEAVVHLTRAIDLCPECHEPHNNLGRVLTLQGNYDGAVKELQRAIGIRPDYAEAYNNLGLAYAQIGALEEALYSTASALHFKPDYAKARSNLRHIVLLFSNALKEGKDSPEGSYDLIEKTESHMGVVGTS